jgi:hypothetical protein
MSDKSIEVNLQNALSKIHGQSYYERFAEINRVETRVNRKHANIVNLKNVNEPVTLIPIADIHLGSKNCNVEKLKKALSLVYDMPNCYTILLGDQTETATKTSIGLGIYDEEFGLKNQLKEVYMLMKPLAEQGKILGSLTGNHEMRLAYFAEVNPMELLAEKLEIDYFGYQGYISIHLGNQIYHIFAHHGVGAASTQAGKLNAMRKLNLVAEADLYLSGHSHARLYDYHIIHRINDETGLVEPRKRHYAICGSFLEYWGGYGEMKLLQPASTGVLAFVFHPDRHEIEVIV